MSFSVCSSLVYRNYVDFLYFYAVSSYIAEFGYYSYARSILVEFLKNFICKISCHLKLNTVWLLVFLFVFLIYFSYLTTLANVYTIAMNIGGDRGHLCLVLDFWRKGIQFFYHLLWCQQWFVINGFYQVEIRFLHTFFSQVFILNRCWILSRLFLLRWPCHSHLWFSFSITPWKWLENMQIGSNSW